MSSQFGEGEVGLVRFPLIRALVVAPADPIGLDERKGTGSERTLRSLRHLRRPSDLSCFELASRAVPLSGTPPVWPASLAGFPRPLRAISCISLVNMYS